MDRHRSKTDVASRRPGRILIAVLLCSLPTDTSGQTIPYEDFEAFQFSSGCEQPVVSPFDSTSIVNGQGPGLIVEVETLVEDSSPVAADRRVLRDAAALEPG